MTSSWSFICQLFVPVFESHQKSRFLTVLRSVSVVSAPINLMIAILLSVRYQQLRIKMFSITQLYIYYSIATCLGLYYEDSQAIVYKHFTFKFNNCPIRCDLFCLLHFCRQLYMFRLLTPIISSWYSCNYSFWY